MKRQRIGLSLLVCAFLVGSALAAPAKTKKQQKEQKEEAQRLYSEGTKAYNLGDFAKAIENYKAAYNVLPEPVFLYNIAQSYRLANDLPQAVFFYKSFLRNMPDAPNRAEVEARVKEIEDQIARLRQTTTSPPNDTVAPGEKPQKPTGTARGTTTTTPPDETGDPVIVGPDKVAEGSDTGIENQTAPTDVDLTARSDGGSAKPIYKKWWFWAGIGAVAAGTAAVVVMSSGGGGVSVPDSHFGNEKIF